MSDATGGSPNLPTQTVLNADTLCLCQIAAETLLDRLDLLCSRTRSGYELPAHDPREAAGWELLTCAASVVPEIADLRPCLDLACTYFRRIRSSYKLGWRREANALTMARDVFARASAYIQRNSVAFEAGSPLVFEQLYESVLPPVVLAELRTEIEREFRRAHRRLSESEGGTATVTVVPMTADAPVAFELPNRSTRDASDDLDFPYLCSFMLPQDASGVGATPAPAPTFPAEEHPTHGNQPETPSSNTSDEGESSGLAADERDELKRFAQDTKGVERKVIQTLIDAGGRLRISDFPVKLNESWPRYMDMFKNTQRRLNKKLRKLSWRVCRHDNTAHLRKLKAPKRVQESG